MGAQIKGVALLLLLFATVPSWAARKALIAVEGAMVYKKADFDAAVIGYLPRGQQVDVSTKAFGPFHRIKFRQGVMGYISDVDIVTPEGVPFSAINSGEVEKEPSPRGGKKSKQKKQKTASNIKPSSARKLPVANAHALGVAFGYMQFRELLNRRDYTDQFVAYGLRYSSKAPFFRGPYGFDVTLLLYMSAPKYYSQALNVPAKGQFIFLDAVWTFPLWEIAKRDAVLVAGIGPLFTHNEVTATLASGQEYKQTDTVIGASMKTGVAVRLGPVIVKTDVNYYLEKSSYLGFLGSAQYEF